MFRRRTTEADSVAGQLEGATGSSAGRGTPTPHGSTAVGARPDQPGVGSTTVGKGRPTPKRSEAEAQRAARLNPPKDRKEALKQQRARAKADRAASRSALMSGDERYLTGRDRGAVRRFVRDWVDARRTVGEYFLIIGLVIVLLSLVNNPTVQSWAVSAWLAAIVVVIGEGFYLSTRLKRVLADRFPEERGPYEGRKGAVLYGLMRAFQLRRLRLPKPRVKPGATV